MTAHRVRQVHHLACTYVRCRLDTEFTSEDIDDEMNKATDAEQTLLADLISLWQQRRAEGQAASPAKLCRAA
jgi:hypothetical protein